MGLRVKGSISRAPGSVFTVWGLGFRVEGRGFMMQGSKGWGKYLRGYNLGFRVQSGGAYFQRFASRFAKVNFHTNSSTYSLY